jgi:hypothetical protein
MEQIPELLAKFTFGAILEGAILFVLDRVIGVKIYRVWYDFTHKVPLGKDVDRGFIYGQKADGRFTAAVLVTLGQSGLAFWIGGVGVFSIIVGMFAEVVGLMIGFSIGPVVNVFWDRRKPLLDVIDRLESHETSITDELRSAAHAVHERIAQDDDSNAPESREATPAVEKPVEEPEPDPREALRAFTGGKR